MDQTKIERTLIGDRNFSLAYELGVMYPTLKSRNLASLIRRQAAEPAGRLFGARPLSRPGYKHDGFFAEQGLFSRKLYRF